MARDVITRAGYGHTFIHNIGHPLGLDVHEAPPDGPLVEGMVVTIEPAIEYAPGKMIVHEENIVIRDEKMLTDADRKHLYDVFHRQVFPVLTPLALDPGHPFPHISNLSLNLAIVIRDQKGNEKFARLKVPDEELAPLVRAIFWKHRRRYGTRRIASELRDLGECLSPRRVARLLKNQGLRAIQPKSFIPKTTDSRHGLGYSPNLLLEAPDPTGINQLWVGDITYLPTEQGWVYLAVVLDLFSRKVVGWNLDDALETDLVSTACSGAASLPLSFRYSNGFVVGLSPIDSHMRV